MIEHIEKSRQPWGMSLRKALDGAGPEDPALVTIYHAYLSVTPGTPMPEILRKAVEPLLSSAEGRAIQEVLGCVVDTAQRVYGCVATTSVLPGPFH